MVEHSKSDIGYEEQEDYLIIKYSKYNKIDEFFDSLKKALKICKENNNPNLILDIFNVDFKKISFKDKYEVGLKNN